MNRFLASASAEEHVKQINKARRESLSDPLRRDFFTFMGSLQSSEIISGYEGAEALLNLQADKRNLHEAEKKLEETMLLLIRCLQYTAVREKLQDAWVKEMPDDFKQHVFEHIRKEKQVNIGLIGKMQEASNEYYGSGGEKFMERLVKLGHSYESAFKAAFNAEVSANPGLWSYSH